jgi:hypothetical protein
LVSSMEMILQVDTANGVGRCSARQANTRRAGRWHRELTSAGRCCASGLSCGLPTTAQSVAELVELRQRRAEGRKDLQAKRLSPSATTRPMGDIWKVMVDFSGVSYYAPFRGWF